MADSVEQPPLPATAEALLAAPIPVEGPDTQPSSDSAVPAPEAVAAQERSVLNLTALTAPTLEELLADSLYTEFKERIDKAREDGVSEVADNFAYEYMHQRMIPRLPEEFQRVAHIVIRYTDFSETGKDRLIFLGLSHVHQAISRQLILHMIGDTAETAESRGFNALEALELRYGMPIADAMDEMEMKWEFMGHDIKDSTARKDMRFDSKWAFVKSTGLTPSDGGPTYIEVSYKELFPKEYARIVESLNQLLTALAGLPSDSATQAKINFYQSLRDAFNTDDVAAMPEAWNKAFGDYVDQPGPNKENRFVTVHPEETAYSESQVIAPQWSLRFRLAADHPLMQKVKGARLEMQEKLSLLWPQEGSQARAALAKIKEGPSLYRYMVRSGKELSFLGVGQCLPNDDDLKKTRGHLITVSPHGMARRLELAGTLFKKFFSEDQHSAFDLIDPDDLVLGVVKHEMGHTILDNECFENDKGGKRNAIEEWKASGAKWVMHFLDQHKASNEGEMRSAFMSELCQAMRYIKLRNEDSQKPYFGSYQFFMKLAQDCRVISKEEGSGEWRLDLTKEKLLWFAATVCHKWEELIEIYESQDQAAFTRFVGDAIQETPFIRDVIACIEGK